jgi:hypothetical protein
VLVRPLDNIDNIHESPHITTDARNTRCNALLDLTKYVWLCGKPALQGLDSAEKDREIQFKIFKEQYIILFNYSLPLQSRFLLYSVGG